MIRTNSARLSAVVGRRRREGVHCCTPSDGNAGTRVVPNGTHFKGKFCLYRSATVTIMNRMQTLLTPLPRTSGRFASLMELYERNYVLVRLIAPRLRELGEGVHVSQPAGLMPLELSNPVHDPYTTTFNLTYRFTASTHRAQREPDLNIRLYHDARTCEVMSGLLPGCPLEPRRTRDLDEGWRLNRFLERWLGYCLRQGHGFGRESTMVELPVERVGVKA